MTTTILALDLGTTTGWALRMADGQILSGTQRFKPGRNEGGGMRFLRFRGWLAELQAGAGTISAVYFEEVRRHISTRDSGPTSILVSTAGRPSRRMAGSSTPRNRRLAQDHGAVAWSTQGGTDRHIDCSEASAAC